MALASRTWLNLGLAIGVAILALLAILEPGKAPPTEQPRLVELNSDGVSKIHIERVNGPTIVLERQQGAWRMTGPLQLAANDYRLNNLLRITETRSLGSFDALPESLIQYGLDSPNATITLNETTRIEFGSSTPIDQRRYVRIGNTVHLISDNLYYYLIGAPTSYASNGLLEANAAITALELPGMKLTQQEGKWQAIPLPTDFSADQVTQLIDHWRHAQSLEVAPYNGKRGERVRLTLSGSDTPVEFLITQRAPELVLARPDLKVQYHLPQSSVAELLTLKPLPKEEPAAAAPH